MKALAKLTLLLASLDGAAPLAAQLCNGLPFRERAAVSAAYVSGEALDAPYTRREYGAVAAYRLPGWTPLGTHHALRAHLALGSATHVQILADGSELRTDGSGGSAGVAYTMDVLPSSVVGAYVVCLSAGAEGEWWRVSGWNGDGFTLPLWLSFGAPLRAGEIGVFPHAGFGGYWRSVRGQAQDGRLREGGLRPWSEAGLGLYLGRARLDAQLRHEFSARKSVLITAGFEL